jgi:chromosome segregation ATPase
MEIAECEGRAAELEGALQGARDELEAAAAALAETRARLEAEELRALAEAAVCSEQADTERALSAQASELQRDLVAKRTDVEKLLSKIDDFSDNEAKRISDTREFSAELSLKQRR